MRSPAASVPGAGVAYIVRRPCAVGRFVHEMEVRRRDDVRSCKSKDGGDDEQDDDDRRRHSSFAAPHFPSTGRIDGTVETRADRPSLVIVVVVLCRHGLGSIEEIFSIESSHTISLFL